jgi:hypothetical protein
MPATLYRFLSAAAWPLTIWTSLSHLEDHPADDYVERTSPIVATAIAFWVCLIALVVVATPAVQAVGGSVDGGEVLMGYVRRVPGPILGVLWVFTPVIYMIGFWLYTARDEAFPR